MWLRAKTIDLADPGAGGVADAVLHQVAQDDPVGVLVEDGLVDLGLVELDGGGVLLVFLELLPLLLGHLRVLDAPCAGTASCTVTTSNGTR